MCDVRHIILVAYRVFLTLSSEHSSGATSSHQGRALSPPPFLHSCCLTLFHTPHPVGQHRPTETARVVSAHQDAPTVKLDCCSVSSLLLWPSLLPHLSLVVSLTENVSGRLPEPYQLRGILSPVHLCSGRSGAFLQTSGGDQEH